MKRVTSAAITILLAFAPILFALAVILVVVLMVSAAPPRARDEVKLPRARDDVPVAQPEVVKPAVIEEDHSAAQEESARIEDERQERYQRYRTVNPWNFQWGNPSRCLGGS